MKNKNCGICKAVDELAPSMSFCPTHNYTNGYPVKGKHDFEYNGFSVGQDWCICGLRKNNNIHATSPHPVKGKNFFDMTPKEKSRLILKSAKESNRVQKAFVDSIKGADAMAKNYHITAVGKKVSPPVYCECVEPTFDWVGGTKRWECIVCGLTPPGNPAYPPPVKGKRTYKQTLALTKRVQKKLEPINMMEERYNTFYFQNEEPSLPVGLSKEKTLSFIYSELIRERNALRRWMKGKQVTKEKVRQYLNERNL